MELELFANKNFTKRYADGSQKKGGKLWLKIQRRTATVRLRKFIELRGKKGDHGPSAKAAMRELARTDKAAFDRLNKQHAQARRKAAQRAAIRR